METLTIAQYVFSQEEKHRLQDARAQHTDGRLKLRFVALLMIAEDVTMDTVAKVIGKSITTLERWGAQYLSRGLESLNTFNYQPKPTSLTPAQIEQMVAWVRTTNPAKTKQVKAYIQEQFHVSYVLETVRQLLHKHGLQRLRPPQQPAHPPSEAVQRECVATYQQMRAECAPGTVFRFLDAMHLVHQNEPGYCWGDPKHPPMNQTNSGRKRLNILGGYNPAEYSLVHVTGEAACNAERVVELLEAIAAHDATAPEIVLFSDNARYFYAPSVREWLDAHPRVWLLPLPAYAPNLNLIERLWRFAKEKLVKNTYYAQYKTFRAQVFRFLNHLTEYVTDLKTLMVEKFQIIHPKIVGC